MLFFLSCQNHVTQVSPFVEWWEFEGKQILCPIECTVSADICQISDVGSLKYRYRTEMLICKVYCQFGEVDTLPAVMLDYNSIKIEI